MIQRIKNNKGMTFVELMVGLLIFTIIATSVTAILAPTLKVYARANDLAEINSLFNNLSDEMLSELYRASDVAVSEAAITIKTNIRTVVYDIGTATHAGILCKSTSTGMAPAFDKRYYKGKTVNLEYYKSDGTTPITNASFKTGALPGEFIVRITLSNQNGVMASRDYAVKPLGLNQYRPEPD